MLSEIRQPNHTVQKRIEGQGDLILLYPEIILQNSDSSVYLSNWFRRNNHIHLVLVETRGSSKRRLLDFRPMLLLPLCAFQIVLFLGLDR